MGSANRQGADRQVGRLRLWLGAFLVAIPWSFLALVMSILLTESPIGNEHPEGAGAPTFAVYTFLTGVPALALVRTKGGWGRALGAALGVMWVVGVLLLVADWASCRGPEGC
jgi:hypothetical protein